MCRPVVVMADREKEGMDEVDLRHTHSGYAHILFISDTSEVPCSEMPCRSSVWPFSK